MVIGSWWRDITVRIDLFQSLDQLVFGCIE